MSCRNAQSLQVKMDSYLACLSKTWSALLTARTVHLLRAANRVDVANVGTRAAEESSDARSAHQLHAAAAGKRRHAGKRHRAARQQLSAQRADVQRHARKPQQLQQAPDAVHARMYSK
jgi:Co/Zn/Cd efflux system component